MIYPRKPTTAVERHRACVLISGLILRLETLTLAVHDLEKVLDFGRRTTTARAENGRRASALRRVRRQLSQLADRLEAYEYE